MKKFLARFFPRRNESEVPGLVLLPAFFMLGAAAGCLSALYIQTDLDGTLVSYVDGYLSLARAGNSGPLFLSALLNAFKYHAIIVVCGLSGLGIVLIPGVMAVRGFLLTYAVTTFVRVLGYGGLLLSAGIFGAQCLIALPCLLLLGYQAFGSARTLFSLSTGGKKIGAPAIGRVYMLRTGLCAAALTVGAVIDAYLTPLLVSLIALQF